MLRRLALFASLNYAAANGDDVGVSKICVHNSAGFVLHWEARDDVTGSQTPDSGRYPIGITRCQDLALIPDIQDGHDVVVTLHAVAGKTKDLTKVVKYDSSSRARATYTCSGATLTYDCTAHIYQPVPVSQVCVKNSAGFVLNWRLQDTGNGNEGASSGNYPIGQARCQNLTEIPGIETGHEVSINVEAVGGRTQDAVVSLVYDASAPGWATYTCTGTTLKFSCDVETFKPASVNVPLQWGTSDCFVTPTFDVSDVDVLTDVVYGSNTNPYSGQFNKEEELTMDVYFPSTGDMRSKRPVVVWMHGGAFLFGDKGDNPELLKAFASRGYVVASINYRIVPAGTDLFALWSPDPAIIATQDARAAVRYLRKMASEWRLDTGRIAVGGASAGALSANCYGFTKAYPEGHSGNPEFSSAVNAVVSLSGSMRDNAFCGHIDPETQEPSLCLVDGADLTSQLSPGDVPVVLLHSPGDQIIPYRGGREVAQRANATGVRNLFLTVPGEQHVPVEAMLDPAQPFLSQWSTFLSGALNLAEVECPSAVASVELALV